MEAPSYDSNHPLVKHLWSLDVDATPAQRIAATIEAYNEAENKSLSPPLSPVDAKKVADWLLNEEINTPTNSQGYSVSLLSPRRGAPPLIHPSLISKISWLSQAPCLVCLQDATAVPLAIDFSVQVKPFSAQAIKSVAGRLPQLKTAIKTDLQNRKSLRFEAPTFQDGKFCVNVVAVVPNKGQLKDPDNMIKGLLDAMQGVIYKNDKQVQHVASHRVVHDGTTGFYQVHIRPVTSIDSDVIDKSLQVKFLSGAKIEIDL